MIATAPKIIVLCNNRMAIPALQSLGSLNMLCAIGVPKNNNEVIEICSAIAASLKIPLLLLSKDNLDKSLSELIGNTKANYVFTMTFPWKISQKLITDFPNTFYNFHYGLLPEMRGADPVFECLRQGVKETGITIHKIEKDIDTGAILLKKQIPVEATATHGFLCTSLSYLGAHILPEAISLLQAGVSGTPQDTKKVNYYKRPGIKDVCLNWNNQNAKSAQSLIRACNPWNKGAYTQWKGWNIRIIEASAIDLPTETENNPGTILSIDENNGLIIQCNDNTQLRADIIYTDEGYMSGHRLLAFGVKEGEHFVSL
ncbi:formyltransferase family protein [Flavobacterium rakeshii]|uniref:methionyl-tRNA formyltransferase n=1 Tax=Flavobacterium rakeshii TaxID=1038845 RepID=UPI002E7C212D|nr:formyltransferase family protein [Flavobacterium rakeshii]MEE1898558.1 formyltransferase family protein [Flavobacterium rakeshii]